VKELIAKGFTLIELMVTIAIVAILAGIAIPAYRDQIRSGRRADAQAALMGLAQAMERDFTLKGTYNCSDSTDFSKTDFTTCTNDSNTTPGNYATQSPIDGTNKFYNLTIVSADATSYVLRATPIGDQVGNGILELTSTGVKRWDRNGNGNTTDTGEACWAKSC
jgi:type IV pilus assembly protein PilE